MKILCAAFLLLFPITLLRADNLLANGDFSDGTSHWEGDGEQVSTGGLIITLQASAWTKVFQKITLPGPQATLQISYVLAPTTTFTSPLHGAQKGPDLGKILGFDIAPGPINVDPGSWMIFLVDDVQHLATYINVAPHFGTDQGQSTGGTIPRLKGQAAKTLYLVFPPGQGSVTLQGVSLTSP